MFGEGLARRALADMACNHARLGDSHLGREVVFAGRGLQLLEHQLHLVEQARRAFRSLAIDLPAQLLDLELQVGDQRLVAGDLGLCRRRDCLCRQGPGLGRRQGGPQGLDLVRRAIHGINKITSRRPGNPGSCL